MTLYAITIFLSAFLLFQVQPLIAKIILPWFGGSAAVWSAAMLFFQLTLLAGYAYAHWSIRTLKARSQMMLHAGLLLVSCALLPILPSPSWKPEGGGDPLARILLLLVATIGLPYFLLSSTSPLLQAWYVRRSGSQVPYRLFALSNFGSMLALISFPFLFEPRLTSRQQAITWSAAYAVFALLCGFVAWVSRHAAADEATSAADAVEAADDVLPVARPAFAQLLLWVGLSACASVLLVAVTNHLSQNVAPIPLLWVVPLALYLITFILAFESDKIYQRAIFLPLMVISLGGMAYMIFADSGNLNIRWAIPGFAAGLFCCCMMCHGELARRRPHARYLTLFYLMVSLGGAIGGIFVALIAPRVFHSLLELPIGLAACGILAIIATWDIKFPKFGPDPVRWTLAFLSLALCAYLIRFQRREEHDQRVMVRNFYGALLTRNESSTSIENYDERVLLHGTINHGSQILAEKMRYEPTSYYGRLSGVGRAMLAIQSRGPMRVGVVGLGAGVLSTYGRKGDYYRIFEINPLVPVIAQTEFSFYPHSPADKAILLGDARLTLERLPPQNFDLLAVDAFSSDAIPIHLLTREALGLYFTHIKPDGILALHISNRYLDLVPVCAAGAKAYGKDAEVVDDYADDDSNLSSSTWVLLTSHPEWFKTPAFNDASLTPAEAPKTFRAWTDDYSNVFQILKWK